MRASLDFLKSSIYGKLGNGVVDGKHDIEKLLPSNYKLYNSALMGKALAKCTVEYICKAYNVQSDNSSSISALAGLQHLMFSLLPKYFTKLFRTGAEKDYGNFRENIVATAIRASQK